MSLYTVTVKAVVTTVYEDLYGEDAAEAQSLAEELLGNDAGDCNLTVVQTKVVDCVVQEADEPVEPDEFADFETEEVVQPYREVTLGFGMREVVGPNATYNPVAETPRAPAYNPVR